MTKKKQTTTQNTKVAIIGDQHFGIRNDNLLFHKFFRKYYEWMFNELEKRSIKNVIQVGDWHDRKKYSNFNTMHMIDEYFFEKLRPYNAWYLAGNHDVSFKNTNKVNSLDTFLSKYDNIVRITDKPETHKICDIFCDFYPWINNENYTDSIELATTPASKFAFGHFEFSNFAMYAGHECTEGMDHKLFNKYDVVFSGHYHTHSVKDNVIYTGTPYELTWSDWNDPKFIFILDLATGEYEKLATPFTMFEKIYYNDVDNSTPDPTTLDIEGKYVKIVVVAKENFFEFDKFINAINMKGAAEVKVIEDNIREMIESVDEDQLCFDDTPTLMHSYIESMEELDDEKKVKLQTLMKQLYIEATTLET